jgi:alanine racemase
MTATAGVPASPRAHARIDLGALRHNIGRLRELVAPSDVLVVVKADAYGHGAVPVARVAREAGAHWLGVAFTDEALALRHAGDTGPLLAWLLVPGDRIEECVRADVDLSASAPWAIDEIAAAARAAGRIARVHLALDTGLGREGATGDGIDDLIAAAVHAQTAGDITVVGMWSHLASADVPGDPSIDVQSRNFDTAVARARDAGLSPTVLHIANSAAAVTRPDLRHDLVRLGIISYGVTPDSALGTEIELGVRPVMSMVAKVALTKAVQQGQGVSYGLTWTAPQVTTLGLVPVGYGDGVPRHGSNVGLEVLIRGRRHPIVGRVCMDQVVVDLGADTDVVAGDEVILFGDAASGAMTAHEWGVAAGTIGYDVVTRVGTRLPKVHVDGQGR